MHIGAYPPLIPVPSKLTAKKHNGFDGKNRDEFMAKFGMLFQGGALFDSMSVWENIAFGLIQGKKENRIEARKIAIKKLGQVGLAAQTADLYPAELSGGMQKRVSAWRAPLPPTPKLFSLMNRPRV